MDNASGDDRIAAFMESMTGIYMNPDRTLDGLKVAINHLIADYAVANGASVVVLIRADNEEPVELAVEFTPGPN